MKDYLIRGIDKNGKFRFVAADTTELVNEAKNLHETSSTASAALGRTLTAGALMSTMLKNKDDKMTLIIHGDGPLGRILVTTNNRGEIKGYVDNPKADIESTEDNKLDVAGIVGRNGYVQTIMDLGLKEPYVGQSNIVSGEIAEDIANYYLTSEQTNTAVALGVLVDTDLSIIKSGGYIVQLLPGVEEEDIVKIEDAIIKNPSITKLLTEHNTIEEVMNELLKDFEIEILEKEELQFKCGCSEEKISEMLKSLGEKEIKDIIDEDKGAEIVCHFCNKKYYFNEEDLKNILGEIEENSEK